MTDADDSHGSFVFHCSTESSLVTWFSQYVPMLM